MDTGKKKQQIELTEKLQTLFLEDLLERYENEEVTDATRKIVKDFLMQNGFSVDPAALPVALTDKLTARVKFDDTDDGPILKAVV